ncbi:MAG TPA: hypothetical protein ENI23_12300 [bacterium]|nr:hypothetical protein [bacterium]
MKNLSLKEKGEEKIIVDRRGEPYGCTIVMSRYSGVYSGARWLAFPLWVSGLPKGWDGGDIECMEFWEDYEAYGGIVGKGETPKDAYKNLLYKLDT